jgi:hypothetical protein
MTAILVATLAATAAALACFLVTGHATLSLAACGALFGLRVAGQIAVVTCAPAWLPASAEWNFVPYRLLLPAQLAVLALLGAAITGRLDPGPDAARVLVVLSFAYWAAMAIRYAVRRRGEIPIVFHCVLAAFVFVLGASHAA